MSDTRAAVTALPDEFVDAVRDGAAARGVDPDVAGDFLRGVLRRLPSDLARGADPQAAVGAVVDLLAEVVSSSGPMVRVEHRAPSLDPGGRHVGVVQVHTPDRPFQLSSVLATVRALDLGVLRSLHPVIGVRRDADDRLVEVLPARTATHRESIIHVELDRALEDGEAERLRHEVLLALDDLTAATDDYDAMRGRLAKLAEGVRDGTLSPTTDEELRDEVARLLFWLDEGNLVLLGVRSYDVVDGRISVREGSGLGILRDESSHYATPPALDELPQAQLDRLLAPQVLRVSRIPERSRVQRRSPLDAVVVLERDADGEVVGLTRVLGLFTRGALAQPARSTPVLRRRLARLLEAEDVVAGSYDEAQLIEVFEAIPRDELFGADHDELRRMVVDLVLARERDEVRAVVRRDRSTGTVSIVATVPQYRYEPRVRQAFTAHLVELLTTEAGQPDVDADVSLADDHEVLVRFAVHLPEDADVVLPTAAELGGELRRLTRSWGDELTELLRDRVGEADAHRLGDEVVPRLPRGYQEATEPRDAIADVLAIDQQVHDVDLRIDGDEDGSGRVRALVRGEPLVLSEFLPLLEDLGLAVLDERPHHLADRPGEPSLHLHDFGVRGLPGTLDEVEQTRVAEALRAAWDGRTASDSLQRLVLSAGLTWQQVGMLRTYRRYRRQVGTAYTPEYVNDALAANPGVVRAIVAYVEARFDPDRAADEDEVAAAREAALAACDGVARLDHDRILRDLVALVGATLRTNLWTDAAAAGVVVLKLDPSQVPDVPAPVPYRELFVLSPRVEGIHLRGGPVARGGLRWSDRQDDVRTEVLGLMKAQVLKNSVIVPTGAKGGFVLQQPPDDRDELRDEVEAQYAVFVSALLGVTDDLDGDRVVPPARVRRWDGDDPYLVVAADKGTATFSDLANGIALEHGFWLGDAFASGGSNGYDHKALGITARGAWVAARRHLLELGLHPEQEPVTVAGVGDMSGDVFGNGLLSSRTIRLVAAFDHRDIFLDPDPDPAVSFDERQRLFDTPRTSWQDYDRSLLSEGAMIVSRDAKTIEPTPQVKELLDLEDDVLSPPELMSAILRAPVDLLWFGGIGTYVKDPDERNEDVGDRANDELRVDADEVRARVIGEGANLSITQRARIRYARRGGRVDQDAIHNVGGVDCSDHEVNVKILLDRARTDGVIDDAERDRLLVEVTDDVVEDVLRDVDLQVWRISRDLAEGPDRLVDVAFLLEVLEQHNALDRAVQVLPTGEELRERRDAGAGLTRPEHATIIGAAKRRLVDELLPTSLPDSAAFASTLDAYFPDLLVERFDAQVQHHRLRRELVATRAANELVDRMGATFPTRVAAEADVDEATVAAAWWVARDVTGIDDVWRALEGQLDIVGPERQGEMARELEVVLGSLTRRYAVEPGVEDPDRLIARDRDAVRAYQHGLFDLGTANQRRHRVTRAGRLLDDLVPEGLARAIACARDGSLGPEVAATLRSLEWEPDRAPLVGDVLLHLLEALGLDRLHRVLDRTSTTTVWRRRLRRSLAADLRALGARATQLALTDETSDLLADGGVVALRFAERRRDALDRALRTITGVEQDVQAGLDGVTVALRTLRTAVEDGPS